MNQLVWFRSDLRVADNTALHAARQRGPTVALYLVTPGQWQRHGDAACKIDFWLRNLAKLSGRLSLLRVPLLVREAETWEDVPPLLAALCQQYRIDCVQANEEYGVNERRRDADVGAELAAQGIRFVRHSDQLLLPPGSLRTRNGGYFQVFGQFRKAALVRLSQALPRCLPTPRAQAPLALCSDPLPKLPARFASPEPSLQRLWPAGELQARSRLEQFAAESLRDYHEGRDFPASDGTSRLSPYLAAGVLSPRQCLHAALVQNRGELDSGEPGVRAWIDELLWREFYKHLLHGHPRLSKGQPFREQTRHLPWRDAPAELAAWQQGRTGFPLVDAAMRCLLATGWMHNRLRMVVAMFLTKNLLIDWREGERWFMAHLIDGDLAANNGGWQWSASTGTDSVPYFRIFNPLNQSQKFDPDGRFIRQWVPELASVSTAEIHRARAANAGLFDDTPYPPPMVELAASRSRALDAFANLPERMA